MNEFVIKNGFISQGNSVVNGTLTATTISGGTFYGNASNLTGTPDNYVTGGTFDGSTLTLNRQNGSVTFTGFTVVSSSGLTLTTTGTSGNATLVGTNLNIPKYVDGDWIDYSATSTIVGWSTFTTKLIKYRVIGKQVFVIANIRGTSNSTSTSFTIPFNSISTNDNMGYGLNNGGAVNCLIEISGGTNLIGCYANLAGWTASGTKSIWVQFFIDIA